MSKTKYTTYCSVACVMQIRVGLGPLLSWGHGALGCARFEKESVSNLPDLPREPLEPKAEFEE